MGLIPTPWQLITGGLRRNEPVRTAVGALLLAVWLIRRIEGARRVLVFSETLKPGQRVMIGAPRPPGQRRR